MKFCSRVNFRNRFCQKGKYEICCVMPTAVHGIVNKYFLYHNKNDFIILLPQYSNHLYSAVQQFLTIFPELRSAPLYIAGESYAGHYVPALAVKIKDNTDENRSINLQVLTTFNLSTFSILDKYLI